MNAFVSYQASTEKGLVLTGIRYRPQTRFGLDISVEPTKQSRVGLTDEQ
jgi:hypothetical protein